MKVFPFHRNHITDFYSEGNKDFIVTSRETQDIFIELNIKNRFLKAFRKPSSIFISFHVTFGV